MIYFAIKEQMFGFREESHKFGANYCQFLSKRASNLRKICELFVPINIPLGPPYFQQNIYHDHQAQW